MDEKRKKKLIWQLPFLALLIVGTVLIISHQRSMPYRQVTDFVFGTTYKIVYQCDSDLTASIRAELKKVDHSLSPFNKESVITAVNENRDVALDPYFVEVFNQSMDVSRQTEGAFDITVAPLVNAWGFGFKHEQMPTPRQVDSLRQIIGYEGDPQERQDTQARFPYHARLFSHRQGLWCGCRGSSAARSWRTEFHG